MPVPSANYISELDPNRPLGTEDIREGDDWFRKLFSVLQNTFPTASGALPISSWAAKNAASLTQAVDYTLLAADDGKPILVDASGGNRIITLPAAAGVDKFYADIVKIDSSANTVTVSGTVSGVVNPVLSNQWGSLSVYSSGAAWINLRGAVGKIIGSIAQYSAPLVVAAGGLGLNASATGGNAPAHVVKQKSVGGAMQVEALSASDLPVLQGATSGADGVLGAVPKPSAGEEDYVLYGGAPFWRPSPITELAKVDLTNGGAKDQTSFEWLSLPATAKEIVVAVRRGSLDGNDQIRLQLGTASAYITAGYSGGIGRSNFGTVDHDTGIATSFVFANTNRIEAQVRLVLVGSNIWNYTVLGGDDSGIPEYGAGSIALGGTATRIRAISVLGQSFDEGSAGGFVTAL